MPGQPKLLLSSGMRIACTVLQLVPVPGVGAIIAGAKNPHSGYLGRGIAQTVLVVLGSWPLIIPGALGFLWAAWDAVRIHRHCVEPGPLSRPTRDAPPETVTDGPDDRRASRQARRESIRQERAARKAARRKEAEEDDTRFMP